MKGGRRNAGAVSKCKVMRFRNVEVFEMAIGDIRGWPNEWWNSEIRIRGEFNLFCELVNCEIRFLWHVLHSHPFMLVRFRFDPCNCWINYCRNPFWENGPEHVRWVSPKKQWKIGVSVFNINCSDWLKASSTIFVYPWAQHNLKAVLTGTVITSLPPFPSFTKEM